MWRRKTEKTKKKVKIWNPRLEEYFSEYNARVRVSRVPTFVNARRALPCLSLILQSIYTYSYFACDIRWSYAGTANEREEKNNKKLTRRACNTRNGYLYIYCVQQIRTEIRCCPWFYVVYRVLLFSWMPFLLFSVLIRLRCAPHSTPRAPMHTYTRSHSLWLRHFECQ